MTCQHEWRYVQASNIRYGYFTCDKCDADISETQYESIQKAHREGWEQGKEESQRTIQQLEAMNKTLVEHISKGITLQPTPVMMADAAAHRMGWERGKSEAAKLVEQRRLASDPFHTIADAIAAMEYKEKTNEQSQRSIRSTKERSLRHSAHVF